MERLPVVVLSGFLGSGKTTLLNRWLRERQDLAVIINELGDIGIDQHLTRESRVPVTLLSGGCLCCVIQGSLSTTLRNLFMARKNGELPAFSTLVLETTGAADPFGVTAPLEQDPWLKKRFFCQSVLTVVDAVAGTHSLERHPEWLEQIHAADALVLSKTAHCESEALAALQAQLTALNPTACIYPEPAPVDVLKQSFPRRCRVTGSFAPVPSGGSLLSSQHPQTQPSRHQLYSASLRWDGRLSWPLWQAALKQLAGQCGGALIRVKGLMRVDGLDGPLLVQWVEGQEPELAPLNQWPDEDTLTRLVLIVRHPQADFAQQQLAHWETLLTQLANQ
ncbi:GTP-binding protein [Alcanivorax sp.]|uniref:CobW family GTP-binding protein n=1 Tax=Alcanivorax sp. TaxID=1872427 RepID=UPI00260BD747|nr:GTP-binding protein [Alcanivorax sp.]